MKNTLNGKWVFDSNLLIYGLDKSSSRYHDVYHLDELDIYIITPINKTHSIFFEILSNSSDPSDIFDYYLAATMLDNGINRILTINTKDFSKIPGIEAVNPFK